MSKRIVAPHHSIMPAHHSIMPAHHELDEIQIEKNGNEAWDKFTKAHSHAVAQTKGKFKYGKRIGGAVGLLAGRPHGLGIHGAIGGAIVGHAIQAHRRNKETNRLMLHAYNN